MLSAKWYHAWRLRLWADDNRPAIVAFALLLIAAGVLSLGRALEARQVRQAQPIVLVATPTLQLLPTAEAAPTVAPGGLPRAVVAYAAPEGQVLGALEPGRPYEVIGRSGSAWVLLAVEQSGQVWVRSAELGTAASVPDLATPQPPQVVYVASQPAPAAPAPTADTWPAPAAASTGGSCLELPGGCRVDLSAP